MTAAENLLEQAAHSLPTALPRGTTLWSGTRSRARLYTSAARVRIHDFYVFKAELNNIKLYVSFCKLSFLSLHLTLCFGEYTC